MKYNLIMIKGVLINKEVILKKADKLKRGESNTGLLIKGLLISKEEIIKYSECK